MGFEIKDSATILGMEINNINTNFNSSAQKIAEKIKKEANWWARFNLSLPGRINVTKSMLYSQLNYLGGFLPFTPPYNALDVINILFKQYIWCCKNLKKLPTIDECRLSVLKNIDFMMKISAKFRRTWENSGINIHF